MLSGRWSDNTIENTDDAGVDHPLIIGAEVRIGNRPPPMDTINSLHSVHGGFMLVSCVDFGPIILNLRRNGRIIDMQTEVCGLRMSNGAQIL